MAFISNELLNPTPLNLIMLFVMPSTTWSQSCRPRYQSFSQIAITRQVSSTPSIRGNGAYLLWAILSMWRPTSGETSPPEKGNATLARTTFLRVPKHFEGNIALDCLKPLLLKLLWVLCFAHKYEGVKHYHKSITFIASCWPFLRRPNSSSRCKGRQSNDGIHSFISFPDFCNFDKLSLIPKFARTWMSDFWTRILDLEQPGVNSRIQSFQSHVHANLDHSSVVRSGCSCWRCSPPMNDSNERTTYLALKPTHLTL